MSTKIYALKLRPAATAASCVHHVLALQQACNTTCSGNIETDTRAPLCGEQQQHITIDGHYCTFAACSVLVYIVWPSTLTYHGDAHHTDPVHCLSALTQTPELLALTSAAFLGRESSI